MDEVTAFDQPAVCSIHNVVEVFRRGRSYGACLECQHVWQTREEFYADQEAIHKAIYTAEFNGGIAWADLPEQDRKEIIRRNRHICPLCTHDLYWSPPDD